MAEILHIMQWKFKSLKTSADCSLCPSVCRYKKYKNKKQLYSSPAVNFTYTYIHIFRIFQCFGWSVAGGLNRCVTFCLQPQIDGFVKRFRSLADRFSALADTDAHQTAKEKEEEGVEERREDVGGMQKCAMFRQSSVRFHAVLSF